MQKKLFTIFTLSVFLFIAIGFAQATNAQTGTGLTCEQLIGMGENPLKWPHCTVYVIGQLIITVINAALAFGGLLLLFNLFRSSLDYLTSGDKTEQVQKARSNITWSIIGLFGIASVYIIYDFVLDLIPGLDTLLN